MGPSDVSNFCHLSLKILIYEKGRHTFNLIINLTVWLKISEEANPLLFIMFGRNLLVQLFICYWNDFSNSSSPLLSAAATIIDHFSMQKIQCLNSKLAEA